MVQEVVRKPMQKKKEKQIEQNVETVDESLIEALAPKQKQQITDIEQLADEMLGTYLLRDVISNGLVDLDMINSVKNIWKTCSLYYDDNYDLKFKDGLREQDIVAIISTYTGLTDDDITNLFGDCKDIVQNFPQFSLLKQELSAWHRSKENNHVILKTIALNKHNDNPKHRMLLADIINRDDHPDSIPKNYDSISDSKSLFFESMKQQMEDFCLPESGFIDAVVSQNYTELKDFLDRFRYVKLNMFGVTKVREHTASRRNNSLENYIADKSKMGELNDISEQLLTTEIKKLLKELPNRNITPFSENEIEYFAYLMTHGFYIENREAKNSYGSRYASKLNVTNKHAAFYLSLFAEDEDKADLLLETNPLFTEDNWAQEYLKQFKLYKHYENMVVSRGDDITVLEQTNDLPSLFSMNPALNLLKIEPFYRPIVAAVVQKTIDENADYINEKHIFSVFKEYGLNKFKTKEALEEINKLRGVKW